MALPQPIRPPLPSDESDAPLIGIVREEDGRTVTDYFMSEAEADASLPEDGIQQALDLAGAWSDLDWDAMEAALDRIRHESEPTPMIDDL